MNEMATAETCSEKRIIYYGVEQTGGFEPGDWPRYTKGLWSVRVGPWDDERQLRQVIEARCRANPDGVFCGHLIPGGIPTAFFRWIS